MNIQDNLLSINQMTRPGIKIKSVKKIVVHYVANPGSTAIANRNYFEGLSRQTDRYASSHYIIGLEGEVIRCIPETEVAYHAGDLEMNYNSIGIENCHFDSSGKFNEKTLASLYELLVELCKKYNLDPSADIIRHYDVTGKICPKYYVDNLTEWNNLKAEIQNRINGNNSNNNSSDANNNSSEVGIKYIVTPGIGLNCREKPDINSNVVTTYKYNEVVEIFEESNGWGRTKDGWSSMEYLKSVEVSSKKYIVTPKIGLNCRQYPDINAKVIKAYKYNEVVEVFEESNGWGRTKDGWSSMEYLKSADISLNKYIVTPKVGLNCREKPDVNSKKIKAYAYNTTIEISEIKDGWGKTADGWVSMQYVKSV